MTPLTELQQCFFSSCLLREHVIGVFDFHLIVEVMQHLEVSRISQGQGPIHTRMRQHGELRRQ